MTYNNVNIELSIIIPVYGVEKHIEQCARSLFEQSLKDNIEFIFVDDASTDHSIEILKRVIDDFPNRKKQIKIIHHNKNQGLPQARKTGIYAAKGKYVIHCDSDDWLTTQAYENLLDKAKNDNADIVICDYYEAFENINKHCHQTINQPTLLADILMRKASGSVWNKMVKRTLYDEKIIYPTAGMGEDLVLTHQLIYRAKKISYLPEALYYYRQNPESMSRDICNHKAKKRFNELYENTELLFSIIELEQLKLPKYVRIFRQLIAKFELNIIKGTKEGRSLFKSIYPLNPFSIIFIKEIPWIYKLLYSIVSIGLYPLYYRLKIYRRRI